MTKKKKNNKYREAVLLLMGYSAVDTQKVFTKYVPLIVTTSLPYKSKEFSFSKNKALNDKIDSILQSISNEIYINCNYRARQAAENAFKQENRKVDSTVTSDFMKLKVEDYTVRERIDNYTSNFKKEIEAYIAIGFLLDYSVSKIVGLWLSNKDKPFKSDIFNKYKDNISVEATKKGTETGRGVLQSSFAGEKEIEINNTFQSYNYTLNRIWNDDDDIAGWYTIRGSYYPCDYCDSQVGNFHDKSEWFYGYHPHCCCIMIPVTKEEKKSMGIV